MLRDRHFDTIPAEKILDKFRVYKSTRDRLYRVDKYDYSFLTRNFNDSLIRSGRTYSIEQAYPLMERFGALDERLANRLEVEFKRFVALTVIQPDMPHAPPGAVDMYWHFFILHTREYVEYCKQVWGDVNFEPRIRDHFPSTDQTRSGQLNAYNATRELYVRVYGEPEPFEMSGIPERGLPGLSSREIWMPGSATSGDSYSGTIDPSIAPAFETC